ncbi:Hypothetical protein PHPALM_6525 [Phytophthora palmivora]|uniref:Uncharacterized protein n=1 Tax=Phytophthora palmivora TaxID=4796 RepID=A0A2P4YEM7_9STRA|nr:Hypothetical protein PHPALM_6525 [Phytophthora palmivora]
MGDSDAPQNYIAPNIEPEGRAFLIRYETLTDEDPQELERVIPSFDPHETITPRAQTPNVRTLDALATPVENGVALINAAAARSECEEIKREWVLNCQYWKHELQVAQQDAGVVEERMSSEIRDLKAHYQGQVEALKANKAVLKYQVADRQAQVSILKYRPDEDTIIPDHWTTIINVTALDERKKPVPDFKKLPSEERARPAAEEAAKDTRVLDLTRSGAGIPDSQSKSPRYLAYPSHSQAQKFSPKRPFKSDLRSLQRRPSGHQPVEDSKEVRPDLRQALLSGVAYDKAMEWLASDKVAHSLFSSPVLVQMLVSVIFSRHLDSNPWTKYVQEVYYHMVDEVSDVESTVDYPKEGPDYKDPGVVDSESEDDDEGSGSDASGDSDSGGDKSKSKRSGNDKSGVKKSGSKKSENKKSDDHSRSGSMRPRESDDDSDSDDGSLVPTQKSKRSRASVIAHTSPKSHPKSASGSGSKSKGSSGKSRSLVSKPYKSLSVKVLQVVETPTTLGFLDYEVHKHSCAILKERWDSERYCAVIRKNRAPWEVMFDNRFSEFYFQKCNKLGPMVLADVEDIVRSMKKHTQAFWERTHWVTMDHNALIRKVLAHRNFPESLLSEPGIWTVPDKACPWIWQDPRVAELGGPKCLTLKTQLGDLDVVEPARMQWATVNVDEGWLPYVPDDIKQDIPTPTERSENPVFLRY